MLVEFTNSDYIFRLGAPKELRNIENYNKISFKRSVPYAYRDASKILDKKRLALLKAKSKTGARVYDSRIKFIGHFLCLRVSTKTSDNRGGIWSTIAYYAPDLENPTLRAVCWIRIRIKIHGSGIFWLDWDPDPFLDLDLDPGNI